MSTNEDTNNEAPNPTQLINSLNLPSASVDDNDFCATAELENEIDKTQEVSVDKDLCELAAVISKSIADSSQISDAFGTFATNTDTSTVDLDAQVSGIQSVPGTYQRDYTYLSNRYSTISLASELSELSINKEQNKVNDSKITPSSRSSWETVTQPSDNDDSMIVDGSSSVPSFSNTTQNNATDDLPAETGKLIEEVVDKDNSAFDVAVAAHSEAIEDCVSHVQDGEIVISKAFEATKDNLGNFPDGEVIDSREIEANESCVSNLPVIKESKSEEIQENSQSIVSNPCASDYSSDSAHEMASFSISLDSTQHSLPSQFSGALKLKHRAGTVLLPEEVVTPPPPLSLARTSSAECQALSVKCDEENSSSPVNTFNLSILSEVASVQDPIALQSQTKQNRPIGNSDENNCKVQDSPVKMESKVSIIDESVGDCNLISHDTHPFSCTPSRLDASSCHFKDRKTPIHAAGSATKSIGTPCSPAREKFFALVRQCHEEKKAGADTSEGSSQGTNLKIPSNAVMRNLSFGVENCDEFKEPIPVKANTYEAKVLEKPRQSMFSSLEIIDVNSKETYGNFLTEGEFTDMDCDGSSGSSKGLVTEDSSSCLIVNEAMNYNVSKNCNSSSKEPIQSSMNLCSVEATPMAMSPQNLECSEMDESFNPEVNKFNDDTNGSVYSSEDEGACFNDTLERMELLLKASQKYNEDLERNASIEQGEKNEKVEQSSSCGDDDGKGQDLDSTVSAKSDDTLNECDVAMTSFSQPDTSEDKYGSSVISPKKFSLASNVSSFNPPMDSTHTSVYPLKDYSIRAVEACEGGSDDGIEIIDVGMRPSIVETEDSPDFAHSATTTTSLPSCVRITPKVTPAKPPRNLYKVSETKSVPVAVVSPNVSPSVSKSSVYASKLASENSRSPNVKSLHPGSIHAFTNSKVQRHIQKNSSSTPSRLQAPKKYYTPQVSRTVSRLPELSKSTYKVPSSRSQGVSPSPKGLVRSSQPSTPIVKAVGPVAKSLLKNPPPVLVQSVRPKYAISPRKLEAHLKSSTSKTQVRHYVNYYY